MLNESMNQAKISFCNDLYKRLTNDRFHEFSINRYAYEFIATVVPLFLEQIAKGTSEEYDHFQSYIQSMREQYLKSKLDTSTEEKTEQSTLQEITDAKS